MAGYITGFLGIVLGLVAQLGLIGTAGGAQIDPHTGDDCQVCHLRAKVTIGNARQLVAPQEKLCARCHETTVIASHPSGVQLSPHDSRRLPDEFPLSRRRTLTCTTCHFVHGEEPHVREAARILDGTFCVQCHAPAFFADMRDGGESLMQFGHLHANGDVFGDAGLDVFSIRCLECHSQPGGAGAVVIDGGIIRHGGAHSSHPIGIDYDRAVDYGGYRPRALLDPALFFPGGRLSCLTCHDGYNGNHGPLVMAARDICLECHLR